LLFAYSAQFCSCHPIRASALAALEEFSELGDGFKVAMRDLDIRGAGNLLGGEQTGFITDLGFDTYHKILDDAIQELKETDFKELFAEELSAKAKLIVPDCTIETDLEVLFLIPTLITPASGFSFMLHSIILKTKKDLLDFRESLKDRFGSYPDSVQQLINTVRLRWIGERLGFEKISLKNEKLRGYFVTGNNEYFKSEVFGRVLSFVQTHPKRCRMKDMASKLILTIESIGSVEAATEILGPLAYYNNIKSVSETSSA
jgi:transcription-repair coupling factor (superfamily II helicase)